MQLLTNHQMDVLCSILNEILLDQSGELHQDVPEEDFNLMDHLNKLKVIMLTAFIIIVPVTALGKPDNKLVESCRKIIIAGNSEWVPYVLDTQDYTADTPEDIELTGVGMELAAKLFAELDVPVVRTAFSDQSRMLQALRTGEIDLVVSSYKNDKLALVAEIISPAWNHDSVAIVVQKDVAAKIKHWEDLAGQHGIMEKSFLLSDETESYFTKYLQIKHQGSLLDALKSVQQGQNNYVVGSSLQLNYAIRANRLDDSLVVVKNLSRNADDVHMALSKRSACQHYATYIRKRLQEYAKNGTVQTVVEKYIR